MPASDNLRTALLDRLAAGWVALGVSVGGPADRTLVDPEALIVMTALHGRDEPRVHEAALDWCVKLGTLVNGARLRTIAGEVGSDPAALAGFAALVAGGGGPRWPVLAGPPVPYRSRGKVQVRDLREPAALAVRLRALFGVAVRADILAVLATSPGSAPSLADLAAATRSTKRNVAIAVRTLSLGGAVEIDHVANQQRVRLAAHRGFSEWLGPLPEPADWATRFTVVEALLRFDSANIASPVARAVEARALAERVLPLVRRTGLPVPDTRAGGEAFQRAYEAWQQGLAATVRP
jgi:hypothetical protein